MQGFSFLFSINDLKNIVKKFKVTDNGQGLNDQVM